jgi:hypothetical protein
MSLGVAVFASVVLILAVYHKGFRKFLMWTGAVAVALALFAGACYFGYDRYTTWRADRATKKQEAATKKGVQDCMLRLGSPMPPNGIAPDFLPADYFNNLTACQAYPDIDIPPPPSGFVPDALPAGYMLDLKGKVAPIPPGAAIGDAKKEAAAIDLSAGLVPKPKRETHLGLQATITCDVVVYDRDMFAGGDPEAIASLHSGDTVQYVGHVTVGDQEIIRIHGRKGYVDGCVSVTQ